MRKKTLVHKETGREVIIVDAELVGNYWFADYLWLAGAWKNATNLSWDARQFTEKP